MSKNRDGSSTLALAAPARLLDVTSLRDYGLTSARSRVAWQADMFHCYYWRLFGIREVQEWRAWEADLK